MAGSWVGKRGFARLARIAVAGGLSALLVVTLGVPANAGPKYPSKKDVSKAKQDAAKSAGQAAALQKKLSGEQAKLGQLDGQVEVAVEAYNGAIFQLGQAKTKYASAKKRASESEKAVEKARKSVAAVASAAYAGGGTAQYIAVFGGDDPAGVATGAGDLNALSQQESGALDRLRAARVVQNIVRKQAAKALAKQRAETKRVAAAKKAAQSKLAAQQKVLDSVAAIEQKVAKRAAADATHASTVASKRQAGIAEARRIAAAKAAAQARKRAAEARKRAAAHHDKGGGGGGPTVLPQSHGGGGGGKAAVRFARAQLGEWYLWAADGPNRWDCSGLTMRAWQRAGRSLPHWSVGQYYQTRRVSLNHLRKGDLVFYASNTNNPSSIHHVALYIGGGRMIEAPHTGAQVRISSIWRSGLIGAGRP